MKFTRPAVLGETIHHDSTDGRCRNKTFMLFCRDFKRCNRPHKFLQIESKATLFCETSSKQQGNTLQAALQTFCFLQSLDTLLVKETDENICMLSLACTVAQSLSTEFWQQDSSPNQNEE